MSRFSFGPFAWSPRIPPVELEEATPEQRAALEACPPNQRQSVYGRTLAQDPGSLAERGALYDSVMYAPRGLPRAEREFATALGSIVTGCVYCTSVHARKFAELTKTPELMQRVFDEGVGTELPPRLRAIADYAQKLTSTPGAIGADDLAKLRAEGFNDLEILDLTLSVAMFANANRLMMGLGDPRLAEGAAT